jgi:hypothetical protein
MKMFLILLLGSAHLIAAGFATHAILTTLHQSRLRMAELFMVAWLVPVIGAVWVYRQLNYYGPKGECVGGDTWGGGGHDGDVGGD